MAARAPCECAAGRTGRAPRTCQSHRMTTTATDASARSRFLEGLRLGVPFAVAGFLVAVSFGVVARDVGLSSAAAIVMSMIVYAGSAQFAAIAILGAGGGVGAAIGAAAL